MTMIRDYIKVVYSIYCQKTTYRIIAFISVTRDRRKISFRFCAFKVSYKYYVGSVCIGPTISDVTNSQLQLTSILKFKNTYSKSH
jgi:hypothetical protein